MIHNDKKTDLTNVFLEGKKPVVTFVPGKSFTFNLNIDNSEVIEELYITSKRNNEEKKLKAIYDEKKGIWIASGYFDSNNNSYVPGTLNISYKTKYEKIDFSGEVDFKQFIEELPPQLQNTNINVTENKNDSIKAEITLNDKNNTKVEVTESVSKVPAGTTISSLLNQGYMHVEDSKYIKYEYTAGSSYLKFTVADMATGMLDYFSAELIDKTPLSGIAGVYGTATDVIQLFGRAFKMDVTKINIQNNPNLSAQQKKEMLNRVDQLANLTVVYDVYKASIGLLTTAGLINPAMGVLIAAVCVIGDRFMDEIFENDPLFNMFMKDGVIINWLIDPSGYVYEAIEENRLQGVTATVYYKDEETGEVVKWNAEDYDQINPQITDENGQYAWDVPEGLWQVKYELEGYETAYSEWLPVPPPQTTVNIEMISKAAPEVTMMNLFDNYVELTFNKYMQVNSVTASEITIKDDKNNSIPVTVTTVDEKTMTNGTKIAKKFIVNLNSNLVKNNAYTVEIKNTVKTYADMSAKENIKITSKYKPLPTKLVVEDSYTWNYGDEMEITVSAEVVEGIENLNLIVNSSITDIISVKSNKVKFDKNGKAKIKLIGNLPGEAILSLNIEGTDIIKEVAINLLLENKDEVKDNKNSDVNGDGVIDILDISLIAAKYNKKSTSDDWNEKLDINNDNIIDMFDLVLVSKKVK